MTSPSRRTFLASSGLGWSATGAASNAAAVTSQFEIEDQEPFRGQTRRLKVNNQGRYVTSLIFSVDYPTHFRLKPELYPVLTPKGFPVTDSHQYCFIHHQSIMCGHGRVRTENGRVIDFYRKLNFPEVSREDPWHTPDRNLYHLGPSGIQRIVEAKWEVGERAIIDLALAWQTREQDTSEGEVILTEQRRYEISQVGSHTIIDHFSRLTPTEAECVLEGDRHSFCGVRVNDLIDVENGGTMRDSEGRVNPSGNYWDADGERKAPRWVDCTGRIGDVTVGIALMGHPRNPRNEFYVREWGLMEVSAMLDKDLSFSKAKPFEFAARYVAHDGEITAEAADALHRDFGEREFLK